MTIERETKYLRDGEWLLHLVHEMLQVVLHVLHHHENVVHALAHYNLTDVHNVLVAQREQDVDLPDGTEWEAVLLLGHLDLLQRTHDMALFILGPAL